MSLFSKKEKNSCCSSGGSETSSCCSQGASDKKENSCCSSSEKKDASCSASSEKDTGECCSSNESEKLTAQCSCGSQCEIKDIEKARFIVLGACCKKSADTFENVKTAVKELGFTDEVINIGDNKEIAKYGVMSTPAFVIESRVVSYGKFLSADDAKKIITSLGIK